MPGVLAAGGVVELEEEEELEEVVEELLAFIPMINLQVPTEGSVVVICATP